MTSVIELKLWRVPHKMHVPAECIASVRRGKTNRKGTYFSLVRISNKQGITTCTEMLDLA